MEVTGQPVTRVRGVIVSGAIGPTPDCAAQSLGPCVNPEQKSAQRFVKCLQIVHFKVNYLTWKGNPLESNAEKVRSG
jgi:hypothetical protein